MTGYPEFNFPTFHAATSRLRAMGYEVVNPAELDAELDGFNPTCDRPHSLAHYMRRDLPAVLSCDAVAVLPGWRESKGACLEVHVARECGLLVVDATTTAPVTETVLQEAQRLVYGQRGQDYGHPLDDYTRTSELWSVILGHEVSAEQAVLCMIAVKISRECNRPKRDNRTDMAGYAECLQRIAEERGKRAPQAPGGPQTAQTPDRVSEPAPDPETAPQTILVPNPGIGDGGA